MVFVGNSGKTLAGNGAFPWFYNSLVCGGSYFQAIEIIPGFNTLCSLPPCVCPELVLVLGRIPCWFWAEQILNLSPNTWNFSIKSSQRLRDYSAKAFLGFSAYSGSKFNSFLWQFIPGFSQGGESSTRGAKGFCKGTDGGRKITRSD